MNVQWIGFGLLALVGGTLAGAHVQGLGEWTRLIASQDADERHWETRDARRPSPHGAAREENAWPHLTEALRLMRVATDAGNVDLAGALSELHLAATCAKAREDVQWERATGHPTPRMVDARQLVDAGLERAEQLARDGRDEDVAVVLLDLLCFGRDLQHGSVTYIGEMIGVATCGIVFERFASSGDLQGMGGAGLARFERGLATLDAGFAAIGPAWEGEPLLIRRQLTSDLGAAGAALTVSYPGDVLRHGLSERWMVADAVRAVEEMATAIAAAAALPWSELLAVARHERAEVARSGDFAAVLALQPKSLLEARRRAIAQVRLLRLAALATNGHELPSLPDPFGATLHSKRAGTVATFWSVGPDGADDGGAERTDVTLVVGR
jgi:hypothetical protein